MQPDTRNGTVSDINPLLRRLDVDLCSHDLRRVAVVAACDPRTVRAWVEGRRMHSRAIAQRIDAAFRELGLRTLKD